MDSNNRKVNLNEHKIKKGAMRCLVSIVKASVVVGYDMHGMKDEIRIYRLWKYGKCYVRWYY